jgi:uncharacterized damage-inducible protein DinB
MIEPLVAELRSEADATRNMLRAVPEEKYAWKPHEKSMSAGVLAKHIATIPRALFEVVNRDSFDVSEQGPVFDSCRSTEELIALFEESLDFACENLQRLSPERASGLWRMTNGSKVLIELPRVAIWRTILLNHLYHHRGQLSVYLRLLDVPVPSTYGPTADVNPFR